MEAIIEERRTKLLSFLEQKKDIIHYVFLKGNVEAVNYIEDIINRETRKINMQLMKC